MLGPLPGQLDGRQARPHGKARGQHAPLQRPLLWGRGLPWRVPSEGGPSPPPLDDRPCALRTTPPARPVGAAACAPVDLSPAWPPCSATVPSVQPGADGAVSLEGPTGDQGPRPACPCGHEGPEALMSFTQMDFRTPSKKPVSEQEGLSCPNFLPGQLWDHQGTSDRGLGLLHGADQAPGRSGLPADGGCIPQAEGGAGSPGSPVTIPPTGPSSG